MSTKRAPVRKWAVKTEKVTVSRNARVFTLSLFSPMAEAVFCTVLLSLGRELGAFSRIRGGRFEDGGPFRLQPEDTELSCLNPKLYGYDYYIDNLVRVSDIGNWL